MDQIASIISSLAVYAIFIGTFTLAASQKWRSGLEDWFRKQFENTIITKLPGGVAAGFWTITVLETITAALFVWSLITLEVFHTGPTPILDLATSMAALTFACLGLGLRIAQDYQGAANLFIYFGATLIVKIYLSVSQFN